MKIERKKTEPKKDMMIVKGATIPLKFAGLATGLVDKAFGNLAYDQSLSEYKENYRIANLRCSIMLTEDVSKEMSETMKSKKKVLFLVNHEVIIYNFRLEIVERLLADGHEVYISSPYGERIDELTALGAKYHEIVISRHGLNVKDVSFAKNDDEVVGKCPYCKKGDLIVFQGTAKAEKDKRSHKYYAIRCSEKCRLTLRTDDKDLDRLKTKCTRKQLIDLVLKDGFVATSLSKQGKEYPGEFYLTKKENGFYKINCVPQGKARSHPG